MDKVAKTGVVVALALLGCSGQTRSGFDGMTPATGLGKFNVAIVNQASETVTFSLRPKNGDWANVSLLPRQKETFSCSACDGKFAIKIVSASRSVEHDLWSGTLYAIRPDYERARYDVYVMQ